MKKVFVTGAGGFIGHHLVKRLKDEGHYVMALDCKPPSFEESPADEFFTQDLRDYELLKGLFLGVEDVYHLAADMGGIGYIGRDKFVVATNNAIMDSFVLNVASFSGVKRLFFSSSACVYNQKLQSVPGVDVELAEEDAWPADPEPGYGLEKLFMEQLCKYAGQEMAIKTHVARFHNVYGPLGTYVGGKEKAPAAICRKVALAKDGDAIEVWGDGNQRRSFIYIDDCVEGIRRLMESDWSEPLNLGSDEAVTICELVELVAKIAGKTIHQKYLVGEPVGVANRNSNNGRIKQVLGWAPSTKLEDGLRKTYQWIASQV